MHEYDNPDAWVENRCLEELRVGDAAELMREITEEDIAAFALISGDYNPAHTDPVYAAATQFHSVIAHGMLGGALISSLLGTRLPGPGTVYLGQSLRFRRPIHAGDKVVAKVVVEDVDIQCGKVRLLCTCTNGKGEVAITGNAEVLAPLTKVRRKIIDLPALRFVDQPN